MYTAIKQAVEQYVDHQYETIIDPQKLDYEHERMHEYYLSGADTLILEIFEMVLKNHPELRQVFDEIEKDLAWKEHIILTAGKAKTNDNDSKLPD